MVSVVGGLYVERCVEPKWNEIFGSGGRAAAVLAGFGAETRLHTYVPEVLRADAAGLANAYGFTLDERASDVEVSFDYMHSLATPLIFPRPDAIRRQAGFEVVADTIVRFGMLEGDARVAGGTVVYDPQSAFEPRPFRANGSTADRLAVVLNRTEAARVAGTGEPTAAATKILALDQADVVILKLGGHGALVATLGGIGRVPAFKSAFVWKIGSGDVFSAAFAYFWGVQEDDALRAAELASRATAFYCNSRALPVPGKAELARENFALARPGRGRIYLAAPFFDIAQRWLVEEARSHLRALGADVFSPLHDVGIGRPEDVAPRDLAGLRDCDAVLAIATGLDVGTIYEIGYARAKSKPVVVLAQNVKKKDLTMMIGSECQIFDDFVTAIYHAVWAVPG
jgi:nucleoside 2-deoxyribosyltransferase